MRPSFHNLCDVLGVDVRGLKNARRRHKEVPGCPSTKFAANAPGHILVEHVEKEHPTSVQPMLDMSTEEIHETKLGLQSTDKDKDSASAVPKKRKSSD